MRRIFIFHFFAGQSERAASAHFTEVGRRYRRVLTCGLYVAQRMFYVFNDFKAARTTNSYKVTPNCGAAASFH